MCARFYFQPLQCAISILYLFSFFPHTHHSFSFFGASSYKYYTSRIKKPYKTTSNMHTKQSIILSHFVPTTLFLANVASTPTVYSLLAISRECARKVTISSTTGPPITLSKYAWHESSINST